MSIENNYGVIRENLFIGRCPYGPEDLEVIQTTIGATAILSLQHDECLMRMNLDYNDHEQQGRALGLTMVRYPLRDHDPDEQRFGLPGAVKALQDLLQAGHRVYVHCTLGVNRAPTVVLAYLTVIEALTEEQAMNLIERGRPGVLPSWSAYRAYRQDVEIQRRLCSPMVQEADHGSVC